jgi:hypothetical protein
MDRWEWITCTILFVLALITVILIVRGGPAIMIG